MFLRKVNFTDGNAWTAALGCRCVPRWIVPGRLGSALGCSGTRLTAEATGTENALGIRFLLKDSNWGALWAFRGVAALASLPVLVGTGMLCALHFPSITRSGLGGLPVLSRQQTMPNVGHVGAMRSERPWGAPVRIRECDVASDTRKAC